MSPAAQRQRRKEARPQELLDAALSLFVEKGFAATRSEEVAARAGVSKGTLYLYYPSKEELLKAVIKQTLSADIAAGAQQVDEAEGPSGELLVHLMTDWWLKIFESPTSGIFKLVITEVRNFPEIAQFYFQEVVEPGQAVISRLIQRGIARGEFRAVDVQLTVYSIILPMVMLCMHKHSLGACGGPEKALDHPEAFIRHHMQLLLQGLQPADAA
ncbi:MAG TPA: TetR/AcrR family transcriptional regulator [Ideonella sp.]|nr:TetR/AcrR family transcriptional regulator [Ideonella sp.]